MKASLKQQFYDEYVTTGQSGLNVTRLENITGTFNTERPYIERVIRRFVPSDRQIRILDLGCGHGGCLLVLKRHGYRNIAGVDASHEQVDAANRLGVPEVELGDLQEFIEKQNEKARVIFLMDVLEHLELEESRRLLFAVFEKLTPNGRLILHVPNGEGLYGQRIRYGDLTHESCFTPRSIRQLLYPIGFKQIECLEDKPIPHGLVSSLRRIIWEVGTIWPRILLMAEIGWCRFVLSQNMLVVADKDGD